MKEAIAYFHGLYNIKPEIYWYLILLYTFFSLLKLKEPEQCIININYDQLIHCKMTKEFTPKCRNTLGIVISHFDGMF